MLYDVVVIGGGPAGLAASIEAHDNKAKVFLIERESRLGGILKQCIHDGFGLMTFNEKLSGPEYAERYIDMFIDRNIEYTTLSFVTNIVKENDIFKITYVCSKGVKHIESKKLILATGCRERSAKQVNIHGTRPAGVLTAGACQHLINIEGVMPVNKTCILGSGDIGLIMARRITLEGGNVVGVFEIMPTPSGLTRNIAQCLNDYNIPLYLSTTVTKVFGKDRLEAIEVSKVDDKLNPIKGTEKIIECDSLVLSVGLMPENELAESLNVSIDRKTKGATCDNNFETNIDGIYTCGNATHVNDLVDYVSMSGKIAGKNAASKENNIRKLVNINTKGNVSYIVPQYININSKLDKVDMFFRANKILHNAKVIITIDGKEIFKKIFPVLRPPEMEHLLVDFTNINESSNIEFEIRENKND